MPGNVGYYAENKQMCPVNVRFAQKTKYPPKMLMWIAFSEHGLSRPYFRRQPSTAINSEIYINECLQKRLLPFIKQHHSDSNYIFWPDLASAHYAKDTVVWMEENINFVPKERNPPNVPQARAIENFWGCLGEKVYENAWEAKNEDQLIRRINAKLKEFDLHFVQDLMRGIKGKLRNIYEAGVFLI